MKIDVDNVTIGMVAASLVAAIVMLFVIGTALFRVPTFAVGPDRFGCGSHRVGTMK